MNDWPEAEVCTQEALCDTQWGLQPPSLAQLKSGMQLPGTSPATEPEKGQEILVNI